jgi:hypothetical protein
MHKSTVSRALAIGVFLCAMQSLVHAQDVKQGTKEETKTSGPRAITAYRLDISINELEDGKKVNARHYSINTTSDASTGPQILQIGTRVPVQSEEGKFTYLDVGTRITARIASWVTPMTVNVSADISSFATPDEATKGGHPLLRQVRIEGTVPISMEKPTVVGTADDPGSKREFQLEVTVVKLP